MPDQATKHRSSPRPAPKDTRVVGTSLTVSISDVLINSIVAFFTGSTVMLSQALQGLSDVTTTTLLYRGVKASKRKADSQHHFGYGRELFFWVIIAGLFMFFGTGMLSVYFGAQQIIQPTELLNIHVAIVVLIISLAANGYAFSLSLRRLYRHHIGSDTHWVKTLLRSSLIETKSTFLVDALGTTAAVAGIVSLGLFIITGDPRFDGVGALIIGLLMMTGALFIIADVRGLIIGRAVSKSTAAVIKQAACSVKSVQAVLDLRTTYIGSGQLLIIIEVHLDDHLDTDTIEQRSDAVKAAIQAKIPEAKLIQVEIETPDEELLHNQQ